MITGLAIRFHYKVPSLKNGSTEELIGLSWTYPSITALYVVTFCYEFKNFAQNWTTKIEKWCKRECSSWLGRRMGCHKFRRWGNKVFWSFVNARITSSRLKWFRSIRIRNFVICNQRDEYTVPTITRIVCVWEHSSNLNTYSNPFSGAPDALLVLPIAKNRKLSQFS